MVVLQNEAVNRDRAYTRLEGFVTPSQSGLNCFALFGRMIVFFFFGQTNEETIERVYSCDHGTKLSAPVREIVLSSSLVTRMHARSQGRKKVWRQRFYLFADLLHPSDSRTASTAIRSPFGIATVTAKANLLLDQICGTTWPGLHICGFRFYTRTC